MAALAKEDPLLVGQGQHPGQLGTHLAARPPVRSGDPAGGQPGAAERRTPGAICRQQPLEHGPREAAMATRRGEDVEPSGVAPAAHRGRGDAEDLGGLRQAEPVAIRGFWTSQNLLKSTRRWATRSLYHSTAVGTSGAPSPAGLPRSAARTRVTSSK